jgi:chromosome segregation ATPase
MATWISVAFKSIPWAKLATSAPDLVQGARALWGSVRENKRREALPIATDPRLKELERQLYELEAQQASFSELIKALAEQNDALVKALGMVHARLRLVLMLFSALAIVFAVVIWRVLATQA